MDFQLPRDRQGTPNSCLHRGKMNLIHCEGRGDTLVSCPNNFGTSLLEKAFPCVIWCSQLSASPGNCPLYLCLQPGLTAQEYLNSHHSGTADRRKEILLTAKSSRTTEANCQGNISTTHSPQWEDTKTVSMITRGGNQTQGPGAPSPKTSRLSTIQIYVYINTRRHVCICHSSFKKHFHSSGGTA